MSDQTLSPPSTPYLPVARLLRPQGRRGELLAEPLSNLDGLFAPGRRFRLGLHTASERSVVLEHCWRPHGRNAGRVVLQLAGIDSISAAEQLGAQQLFVEETALPARDLDTYLVRDLVGCTVLDGVRPVGTILDLQFPVAADGHTRLEDAADLLVVGPPGDAEPLLIPFVKAWIRNIDLPGRQIAMQLPPGLCDSPDAAATPEAP